MLIPPASKQAPEDPEDLVANHCQAIGKKVHPFLSMGAPVSANGRQLWIRVRAAGRTPLLR
ncbi:MAG: hypothetical protein LIP04_14040 [Tannerellaceae bacterium]|nr:hypothetical protein [Tannerellaceae bacterium]